MSPTRQSQYLSMHGKNIQPAAAFFSRGRLCAHAGNLSPLKGTRNRHGRYVAGIGLGAFPIPETNAESSPPSLSTFYNVSSLPVKVLRLTDSQEPPFNDLVTSLCAGYGLLI